MKNIQIVTALLAVLFLTTLIACSSDIEEVPPIANFVSAKQPGGCGTITVTFDNPPRDVTVSTGFVTVSGNTAMIEGPFTPGTFSPIGLGLTITWTDGTQVLNGLGFFHCE